MSLTFVECTDCWPVQRGTYDSMYMYACTVIHRKIFSLYLIHIIMSKDPYHGDTANQYNVLSDRALTRHRAQKRLIFNECSITFVFFLKYMHLWIIQYFPYVQNAYLCGKKGKDVVHIFTKIPRGIKLELKFMYRYI